MAAKGRTIISGKHKGYLIRQALYTLALCFLVLMVMTAPALADGWFKASTSDTIGSVYWKTLDDNPSHSSPHGGYVSTSNLCKTCHAVHNAGQNSYRMLKSGVSDFEAGADRTSGETGGEGAGNKRSTECMYCHDATAGATVKRPYELSALGIPIRGEHTLGASVVPDSNINGGVGYNGNLPSRDPEQGAVLNCFQCHSVHGADTIGFDINFDGLPDPVALDGNVYDSDDGIESWNSKILRIDPSGDGVPLAQGQGGMSSAQLTSNTQAVKTGFCADCHNQNPNWVMDNTDNTDVTGSNRPNPKSHPQGPGTDGMLEMYGENVSVASHLGERQGCRGCHTASDNTEVGPSHFPHQSVGWKLLWDNVATGTPDVGSPTRVIPAMDQVCQKCHNPLKFDPGNYADVEEVACYRCHDVANPTGAPDILTQFDKASKMPLSTSGKHVSDTETAFQLGYNGGSPNNRHVECLDCHNPEREVQGSRVPQLGATGLSVVNGAPGTVPGYTMIRMTAKDSNSRQYKLCFKCHSAFTTRPNSNYYVDSGGSPVVQGDRSVDFNTNNSAFHPVEGVGRNQSQALKDQLYGGLTTDATLNCTDCHNADETSSTVGKPRNSSFKPQGPHGSTFSPILRAFYRTDISSLPSSYSESNFKLCFRCHDSSKLFDTASPLKTNFSRTKGVGKQNLHLWHLKQITAAWDIYSADAVAMCRYCHYNIHSNQQAVNTQYEYYKNGTWTVSFSPPASVKTRMINFAPVVTTAYGGNVKPAWRIWLEADPAAPFSPKFERDRQCVLECHGNGNTAFMFEGFGFNTTYRNPDAGQDNDPLEF